MLFVVVGLELAEISRAHAVRCRFDLHPEKVRAVLDADVVGLGVSPRFADGEMVQRGLRHEQQFYPFAALFEIAE